MSNREDSIVLLSNHCSATALSCFNFFAWETGRAVLCCPGASWGSEDVSAPAWAPHILTSFSHLLHHRTRWVPCKQGLACRRKMKTEKHGHLRLIQSLLNSSYVHVFSFGWAVKIQSWSAPCQRKLCLVWKTGIALYCQHCMFRNLLPEATKEKKNKDKKVNDAKIKRCIYCQHAQKNFLFCIKKKKISGNKNIDCKKWK